MQTMIVSLTALAALQLAATGAPDEKSSYITTLGRDTVAVESVARLANHLIGDIVVRVPNTIRLHYDVEVRPDGSVLRSTLDTDPMGAKGMAARRMVLEFTGDSVRVSTDSAGQKRTVTRALPKGIVPTFMTGFGASYGLY